MNVSEIDRIRSAYHKYDTDPANRTRWGRTNAGNRAIVFERQQRLRAALKSEGLWPLSDLRILEVGCGGGGVLGQLLELGASEQNLVGVDLLENRIAEARKNFPTVALHTANAECLPFDNCCFDLVAVFTVFSSILDADMASRIASECTRVLRIGGGIIWYDFRFNNPNNKNVRGMRLRDLRRLFPHLEVHVSSITLLPPLARRMGKLSGLLYHKLALLPFLRTHLLGILKKEHAFHER